MSRIGLGTVASLAAQRLALQWAKEHLPEEKYREIEWSYRALSKRSLVFVICCVPIMIVLLLFAFYAPFSTKIEAAAVPEGARESVLARVDYDGNFYWTQDSEIYEYALKDYGLSPESFEFGDRVKVYLDDVGNIVTVTGGGEGNKIRNLELAVGVFGAILVPTVLIVGIYMPIAYRSFGKKWIQFYREYEGREKGSGDMYREGLHE